MDSVKKYTDEQIVILRETSMVSILGFLGYDTARGSNGLYKSPFRNESVGSLHINDARHIWCDHGGYDPTSKKGKPGGDTIKFVQALKGCSFIEALDFLHSFNPNIIPISNEERQSRENDNRTSKVNILQVEPLTKRPLIEYSEKTRRIPLPLLQRYCSQLIYKLHENDNPMYAIGFPNRSGGWAMRNALEHGLNKFSSASDITVIDRNGNFMTDDITPTSKSVVVFEGFFDFLSWLAWNASQTPRITDVVVLNSTSNQSRSYSILEEYDNINLLLDNDATGRKTAREYIEHFSRQDESGERYNRVKDLAPMLDMGSDFGEMWVKACRKAEVKAFEQEMDERESTGIHR